MVDLSGVECADNIALAALWYNVCDDIGMNRTKNERARVHWIGLGVNKDVLRDNLIAYRNAKTDAARERALLAIVESYDADVKAEA